MVSVDAEFDGLASDATQIYIDTSEKVDLSDGFSAKLYAVAGEQPVTEFTIGDQIKAVFTFNAEEAGYEEGQLPFAFFASQCYVQNQANEEQKLFLIGSPEGGLIADKCFMDQSLFNLHISTSIQQEPHYTSDKMSLSFDTFRFDDGHEMLLVCNLELCLLDDCPIVSSQEGCDNPIVPHDDVDVFIPPVNECEELTDACPELSTCHDLDDGFWCECPAGKQMGKEPETNK